MVTARASGAVMVTLVDAVQPLASNTETLYVPADKLVAKPVFPIAGSLHE